MTVKIVRTERYELMPSQMGEEKLLLEVRVDGTYGAQVSFDKFLAENSKDPGYMDSVVKHLVRNLTFEVEREIMSALTKLAADKNPTPIHKAF